MNYPEKSELCHSKGITLNGHPAHIVGAKCEFAQVIDFESGIIVEYSWEAVSRTVRMGGRFLSNPFGEGGKI